MIRFWLSTSLKEDMMSSVSIFCGDVLVVSLSSVSSTRSIIGCDDDATEDFFFVLVTILIFKKGDNKEIMLKNFIHRRQDGESQTNVILLTHMIYLIYNTLLAEYAGDNNDNDVFDDEDSPKLFFIAMSSNSSSVLL
jgi:hypothetical protein